MDGPCDQFLTQFDLILSPVTAGPPPLLGALSLNQPYADFVPKRDPGLVLHVDV